MKIIILGPREPVPPSKGGAIEKLTWNLAKALTERGVEVWLLGTTTNPNDIGRVINVDGVNLIYVSQPIRGSLFYFRLMPFISKRIMDHIENTISYDKETLIHSVYFYNLISIKRKRPIVVSEFEHYPWIPEYLFHRPFINITKRLRWDLDRYLRISLANILLRKATIVHSVSRYQARLLQQFLPAELGRRIVVIPNFVDTNFYRPSANPESLREKVADGFDILVGFLGRFTPHKGLHLLIKALALIDKNIKRRLRLIIIGPKAPGFYVEPPRDDTYLQYLIYLIKKYDLEENIVFLGNIKEEYMPKYISTLDFVVHPSFAEAFGLVLIESMACAKPVITFDIPPMNEIVNSNIGLLVDMSAKSLAKAIELMASDASLRAKLGSYARDYVERKYSLKSVIIRFIKLYETVLYHDNK